MDLNEHTLSEAERTLKRLGVTHVFESMPDQDDAAAPSPPLQAPAQAEPFVHAPFGHLESPSQEEALPPLLRSLFHGKHAPVRTMWTYKGLYEDMQQAEPPARMRVFRKIQESVCLHLKWASCDIAAWPLDVSEWIFHKGIAQFRPRTVLLFNDNLLPANNPVEKSHPYLDQASCDVIILPSLENMAQGDRQLKNEAWKILQAVPR